MTGIEKTSLSLGFVPLTDSAPLVVAKALGFFDDVGLDVTLQKQNSWATLRDKLHAGILDAAQMLAPMPIASTLGLGCRARKIVTPFVLSLNGNAITLSDALYLELKAHESIHPDQPLSAEVLNSVIARRSADGKAKLKLAHVFPYSCHHYQLLDWLKSGGVTLSDIDILTVPPVNMVDFLFSGEIDGYCVGGPWNAKAVRSGIGYTGLTSYDVWQDQPEKVLGFTADFVDQYPQTVTASCVAIERACRWLENIPNRFEAARMLTHSHYLDAPLDVIAPSLLGSCLTHEAAAPREVEQYNRFYSSK
ncbi:nitrate ABC transporter ATP-binding protein, partial [Oleiphilus sp. HI0122]